MSCDEDTRNAICSLAEAHAELALELYATRFLIGATMVLVGFQLGLYAFATIGAFGFYTAVMSIRRFRAIRKMLP